MVFFLAFTPNGAGTNGNIREVAAEDDGVQKLNKEYPLHFLFLVEAVGLTSSFRVDLWG